VIAAVNVAIFLHQQALSAGRLHGAKRGGLACPHARKIVKKLDEYLSLTCRRYVKVPADAE